MGGSQLEGIYQGPLFKVDELQALCSHLKFTKRQVQVIELLLDGRSDKQIAASMGVTAPTVRSHLQSLFRLLKVGDRTSLVIALFKVYRAEFDG